MGMFDTIRCEVPLPGLPDPSGMEFQTKDLCRLMDNYTITTYGRLVLHFVEYECTPEDELPYKDDPNPFMRICGSLRVKKGSEKDVDKNFHGILNFYGNRRAEQPEWFEYNAKFTDGKLVSVERVGEEANMARIT